MRNIVYKFDDSPDFSRALEEGDQELALPRGDAVKDGEWVLVIFEVGQRRRSTSTAARGLHRGPTAKPVLTFERRDWERLVEFAEATGVRPIRRRRSTPGEPPTEPRPFGREPTSSTRLSKIEDAGDDASAEPSARILLVDDDRDICEVVGAMLGTVGLAVDSIRSGEEALARVRRHAYDLLVLDWNLPGMTGLEICRRIRKDPKVRHLPVIFLTAHASSADIVEAFASGADDYVVKPFRAPELGARIFSLVRRSRTAAAESVTE